MNKDDGDGKDEPSCWNEADNFAEATNLLVIQGKVVFDDGDKDDEVHGVMGNPNAGQGSSPMHGKGIPVVNLIKKRKQS